MGFVIHFQGPKLTLLGRRQLVTEGKMWSPKSLNKCFSWQRNNFSSKNQNEENAFGAAMVIFWLTIKIKYKHADYLYT